MADSRWPFLPQRLRGLFPWRGVASLPALLADNAALDFRIVGRTLLHAAAVGIAAGIATLSLLIICYIVLGNWTSVTGGQQSLWGHWPEKLL